MADFDDLIYVFGDDPALVAPVKKAMEEIYALPEGKAIFEEAHRLHSKFLTVYVDGKQDYPSGYEDKTHAIRVNPLAFKGYAFRTETGEKLPFCMVRALAHESEHAAHPDPLGLTEQYAKRLKTFQHEAARQARDFTYPKSSYTQQFITARSDPERLKQIYQDIFDNHYAPAVFSSFEWLRNQVIQDPTCKRYLDEIESPAIAFENLIMSKQGQPGRILDYAQAAVKKEVSPQLRSNWVADYVAFHIKRRDAFYAANGIKDDDSSIRW